MYFVVFPNWTCKCNSFLNSSNYTNQEQSQYFPFNISNSVRQRNFLKVFKLAQINKNVAKSQPCASFLYVDSDLALFSYMYLTHGLRTPREEIAFTARPKIHSHSQIFRYGRRIFCLPHRPNFSDIFDLCLHWVSVVRDYYLETFIKSQIK